MLLRPEFWSLVLLPALLAGCLAALARLIPGKESAAENRERQLDQVLHRVMLLRKRNQRLGELFPLSRLASAIAPTVKQRRLYFTCCPACDKGRARMEVRIDSVLNHFYCSNCHAEGGSAEFILLADRKWKTLSLHQNSLECSRFLESDFYFLVERARAVIQQGGGGGPFDDNGQGGVLAPNRPRGPWRPPSMRPREVSVALPAEME